MRVLFPFEGRKYDTFASTQVFKIYIQISSAVHFWQNDVKVSELKTF